METRFRKALSTLKEDLTFAGRAQLFRNTQVDFYKDFPIHASSATPFRYFIDHLFPPTRLLWILHYNWHYPGWIESLVSHFPAPVRHVVFGHSHRGGRWQRGEVALYNTGSFMPYSRPWAVRVEGKGVTFFTLDALLGV